MLIISMCSADWYDRPATQPFTVQGWSSVIPHFSILDFVSFYIEVPIMTFMTAAWLLASRRKRRNSSHSPEGEALLSQSRSKSPLKGYYAWTDLVDVETVDLYSDEHDEQDSSEDDQPSTKGIKNALRRIYYWVV